MKYSVIGSGSIGKALARRFSRSGIDLGFAAIALGRVDEGGKLLSIEGSLMLQNLVKHG